MNMIKILAGAALVIASAGEIAAQSSQMALDFLANQWGQPLSDQYESAAKAGTFLTYQWRERRCGRESTEGRSTGWYDYGRWCRWRGRADPDPDNRRGGIACRRKQDCPAKRARHLHPTHRRNEPPSPQDRDIIIAALKEPGSEDFIALEPGEV